MGSGDGGLHDRRAALRRHRGRHRCGRWHDRPPAGAHGKRILLLERGDYLPRERDNWDSTAVFVKGNTARRNSGSTNTETGSRPRSITTWAATPSSTAPRSSVCAPRTSANSATTTASPRLATELRGTRAVLHPGRASTSSTAGTARTRPRVPPAPSTRIRRSSTSRASSSSAMIWRSRGCTLPPPDRGEPHPGRPGPGHPHQRLHPLRPCRRLPLPGRREVRRTGHLCRPRPGTRQRRDGHPRGRAASGDGRDRPQRHLGRRDGRERGGEGSTVEFSADIVVIACGAVNSAVLLLRSANDRHPRGWPTARTSWAGTTCGTTTSP